MKMNMFRKLLAFFIFIVSLQCSAPTATKDWEYLAIIGTVDGNVHGINEYFQKVWTTSTGEIMLSGSSITKDQQNDQDAGTTVIPALDGTLLYHNKFGMRKTAVKARTMIESSPIINKDGVILTGKKSCRLLGLDLNDGSLLADISPYRDNKLLLPSKTIEKTGLNNGRKKSPFWLGRIDYLIQGIDTATGTDQFKVSYSELQPVEDQRGQIMPNEIKDLDLLNRNQNSQGIYMEQLGLVSTPDGAIYFTDSVGKLIGDVPITLGSPAMNAFIVRLEAGEPRFTKKMDIQYSVNNIKLLHKIKAQPKRIHKNNQIIHTDKSAIRDPLILVQSSKVSSEQSDYLYAMELEVPDDVSTMESTENWIQPIVSPEEIPEKLSTPLQNILVDSSKTIDSRKLGNKHHLPFSINKGIVRRPPSGHPFNKKGYVSSFMHTDRNTSTSELPSKQLIIPESQHPQHHVSKIRGLHRLKYGKTDENFWLEQISTEIKSKVKDFSVEVKAETNNSAIAHSKPIIRSVLDLWTGMTVFILVFIVFVIISLLFFVWFVRKYQIHILPPGSFVDQSLFCFETIVTFLRKVYLETIEGSPKTENELPLLNNENRVGALSISDKILGYGSHGTIVYQGFLNGRPVAVKRMLAQFNRAAEREISMLIKSDGHPNVVRYFLKEQRNDFVYLGLQLCDMSLKDFINNVRSKFDKSSPTTIGISDEARCGLLQVAEGLSFLHSQKIVHRDIKPHNILCATNRDGRVKQDSALSSINDISKFILKISDMGLSKQLDEHEFSFSSISMSVGQRKHGGGMDSICNGDHDGDEPVGTIGWQAPELISARKNGNSNKDQRFQEDILFGASSKEEDDLLRVRKTLTVDIFSLGCVFYFVLSCGEHPFGHWYERESNILINKHNMSILTLQQDAIDLITWMLNADPLLRPTCKQVKGHPFFWSGAKRLEFLVEFSDRLEKEPSDSPIVLALESNSNLVLQGRWDKYLDQKLMEDIGKYRKYDVHSVRDLLRLIRNKKHHFHELAEDLKSTLSPMPNGFYWYFESKFPYLLLHCGYVANKYLKHEGLFGGWLQCFHVAYMSNIIISSESSKNITNYSESKPTDHIVPSVDNNIELIAMDSPTVNQPAPDIPAVSTDQNLRDVVIWQNSNLESTLNVKGWWRDGNFWMNSPACSGPGAGRQKKGKASHLIKSSTDLKFRTRLCTHWESTGGDQCPMRKKGKCIFAHGPSELRVKETRRDRWAKYPSAVTENTRFSGGEDVLGAAQSIEKVRVNDGSLGELERSSASFPPPPELNIRPSFHNGPAVNPTAYNNTYGYPPYYGQHNDMYNYNYR